MERCGSLGRAGCAYRAVLPRRADYRPPPFALETMLRVHFLQQWFSLSDPAMEEAFFDTPLYREFAQLDVTGRMPDESTILRFRHRSENTSWPMPSLATVE